MLGGLGDPAARKSWKMQWPSSRKHPSPDWPNICGPAELAARQLGRHRQLGGLGSPAQRKSWKMRWPGSRNILPLTWPTFAARRNRQLDSSTARQVGQSGGKGSHGRCGGLARESIPALTWPTLATRRKRHRQPRRYRRPGAPARHRQPRRHRRPGSPGGIGSPGGNGGIGAPAARWHRQPRRHRRHR